MYPARPAPRPAAAARRQCRAAAAPPTTRRLEGWFTQSRRAQRLSLRQLAANPLGSLFTTLVLSVALALPACFLVALDNLQGLFTNWSGSHELNVFYELELPADEALRLSRRILARPDVEQVKLIDRDAALEEFRRYSGMSEALEALEENPLPAMVMVYPRVELNQADRRLMAEQLGELPGVDSVRFDRQWALRLGRMLEIARRVTIAVAVLLGFAVLIVVGNTARLEVLNRREDIRISMLFGASKAFIRRPFIYTGLWFGLCGGGLALLAVYGMTAALQEPVRALAAAYGSDFELNGPGLIVGAALPLTGALLGMAGSSLLGEPLYAHPQAVSAGAPPGPFLLPCIN